ncbi:MAG: hypothetical protein CL696_06140 [Chloroflexi bacterium]|nr:hypothetical protein [Chloroflexota bacterium]
MRLFYQTKTQNAQSILRDGFRDTVLETTDDGETLIQGVRLFDDPLGWPLGVAIDGNAMLSIEIPEDAISEHELAWTDDDGIPLEIREFAVPASLANSYGPPMVEDVDLNPRGLLDGIDLSGIGDDPDSGGFAGPTGGTSPFGNN